MTGSFTFVGGLGAKKEVEINILKWCISTMMGFIVLDISCF